MSDVRTSRIIFVDDEQRVLDGLKRNYHSKRHEWSMRFAISGEDALHMLEEEPADVIVSDMRMPNMDGATLLATIRERWPNTVRLILSGQTDQERLLSTAGAIHQFLQKPCDPAVLAHSIVRSQEMAHAFEGDNLHAIASGVESLPVLSATYTALSKAIADETNDSRVIAEIVSSDIGLSTKLLQMVNSAFFGLPRKMTGVEDAIKLIGMDRLKVIAITAHIIDTLGGDESCNQLIDRLWRLSSDIGAAAAAAAKEAGASRDVCETARLAGTLSLIGRALLARMLPDRFEEAIQYSKANACSLTEAEIVGFGVPQQVIGAYALGLWAFDDMVVECVMHQGAPERSRVIGPVDAVGFVHAARAQDYGDPLADLHEYADGAHKKDGASVDSTGDVHEAA